MLFEVFGYISVDFVHRSFAVGRIFPCVLHIIAAVLFFQKRAGFRDRHSAHLLNDGGGFLCVHSKI